MPKGCWVGQIVAHDLEGYAAYNAEALTKYGTKFLVRGVARSAQRW